MRNVLFALMALTLFACKDDEPQVLDCNEVTDCTEVFRIMYVEITMGGSPAQLDNVVTINETTGEVYEFDGNKTTTDGQYIVVTDGQMNEIEQTGTKLRLQGDFNRQQVLDEAFTIGHDCCHITYIDGTLQIAL